MPPSHDDRRRILPERRIAILGSALDVNNSIYAKPSFGTDLMRIAMLSPYWHPIRGGLTSYVTGLSEELRRSAVADVRIIAHEGGDPGATTLGGQTREFSRRAIVELERIAPDAIHAHGHWYALAAALRYRNRHRGTRVIFTLHTEFPRGSWIRKRLLSRLLSRADFVTSVSADLLARTRRDFRPRTRTRVTPPGVAPRAPPPARVAAFLRESSLDRSRPLLAFVGPLAYEEKARGVARLIEAMRLVRAVHRDAVLVVAGDGPHRPALEDLAARIAPGACRFLGTVEDPSVLLTAADVYTHISFQEGLPIALLEAMACGRPVVATSVGGVPEVVRDGKTGILVAGEPQEIADAVLRVLEAPAFAAELGGAARADALERFSWARASARFLPLYGAPTRAPVIVTVDLERDYATRRPSYQGVEKALPRLLVLLESHGIKAHFFVTADLCEHHSDALRMIAARGHFVGCHGESHDVPYLSSRSYPWQLASIRRATDAIERCTGVRPSGFRAPNFSANSSTIRALEELGYRYDSSVLPGRIVRERKVRTRVDFLAAPRDPYRPSLTDVTMPDGGRLVEFPVTENPFSPGGPIGLGFLNTHGVARTMEAMVGATGAPVVFLIHPWELVDAPEGGPEWMQSGCTSDESRLDAFLAELRVQHDVTTFDEELWVTGLLAETSPAPAPGSRDNGPATAAGIAEPS